MCPADTPDTEVTIAELQALAHDVVMTTRANAASAEKAKPGARAGPDIPPLPPGTTLDLTHPTIQLPNVPEFKIPDHLSVASGSAVIGPGSLTTEDWIVIAKNNNFLRAYTLADPPDEQGDPPRAATLALDYMVPTSADFYEDMHLDAKVLTEVMYSSATASYVRAGFDTQSASLSIPYAAASFERQRKEREARASSKKTIYMIGRWFYPRAKLHIRKFTKASSRLTAALEAAVNTNDPVAVKQVFNDYGWAVPEEVVIGGQLFFVHQELCDASVNEREVEETIKAAVTAKYSNNAQATAGISFGSGSSSKVTAEQVNQRTTFAPRGGDTILATNPPMWADSVKDPRKWAVIRVSKLAPITDWLEPALRAKVERILPEIHAPALQMPEDVSAEHHSARAESDGFVFGMRKINDRYQKGAVGGLQLVCGSSGSPNLDQSDAVGGRATFHSSHRDDASVDIWIDAASICLPVPKGSHYSVFKWDDYRVGGDAASRFTKTETELTFGKWQTLADRKGFTGAGQPAAFAPGGRDSDGFIFCSVRAPRANQDRGVVSCTVDGKILGAASVHYNTRGESAGSWGPDACFCVPVPRHLSMSIDATARAGMLDIKVWYLASTSQGWKFGKAEPYTLDSFHTAETDGFLNGVVTVREGNARGMLSLFCGPDRNNVMHSFPPAMVAVHQTSNRFIPYASAMLPIRRGFVFRSVQHLLSADQGHRGATVEAYWTPLLPVA